MNSSLRPNLFPIESPSDLVGRDVVICRIWDILNHQSVLLEGPRRIGKTSLLLKMFAEPPPGWEANYLNIEDAQTTYEFVSRVHEAVTKQIHRWGLRGKYLQEFERRLGNIDGAFLLRDTDGPWKDLLIAVFEDLSHAQEASGRRALLIFDEMQMMLEMIANRQGNQTAIEVLDLLRYIRHSIRGVRMLLSGEFAVDQIFARLLPNSRPALNDLCKIELEPLEHADAIELASRLMDGMRLDGDRAAAATRVADITRGIPFYIHMVVGDLARANVPATPATVDQIVAAAIASPSDSFALESFRSHFRKYYRADEQKILFAILSHLAAAKHPVPARKLFDLLNISDEELVFEVLRRLRVDRILLRNEEGYSFQDPILRQWWAVQIG
jgi:hypothetical protein